MTGARAGAMTRHIEPEFCPWPPIGNRVDPQASADAMKARFAALDAGFAATANEQDAE